MYVQLWRRAKINDRSTHIPLSMTIALFSGSLVLFSQPSDWTGAGPGSLKTLSLTGWSTGSGFGWALRCVMVRVSRDCRIGFTAVMVMMTTMMRKVEETAPDSDSRQTESEKQKAKRREAEMTGACIGMFVQESHSYNLNLDTGERSHVTICYYF